MGNNKYKNKFYNKKPQQYDNYIPSGKKEDLDRKIEDLNLSKHCYDALKAGNIVTLRDICIQKMSKMYRIQNIGKRDCIEIANKLKHYSLAFRVEDADVENSQVQNRNQTQNKQTLNKQVPKNVNPQKNNNQPLKNNLNFSIHDDRRLVEYLTGQRQHEVIKWEDEPQLKLDIIKFCRNGKWGYKDQKGNVLIQPAYDEACQFSEERACVEKNGKLGYIDKEGNIIVDFKYDCANSFSDGLACVTENDKTGYIDKDGNIVFELKYEVGTPFVDGKALIKEDNKWGVLDKTDGSIYWR